MDEVIQNRNLWLARLLLLLYLVYFRLWGLYYRLYRKRPNLFLFTVEIQNTQRGAFAAFAQTAIEKLVPEIEALSHLSSQLSQGGDFKTLVDEKTKIVLPSGNAYTVTEREQWIGSFS